MATAAEQAADRHAVPVEERRRDKRALVMDRDRKRARTSLTGLNDLDLVEGNHFAARRNRAGRGDRQAGHRTHGGNDETACSAAHRALLTFAGSGSGLPTLVASRGPRQTAYLRAQPG